MEKKFIENLAEALEMEAASIELAAKFRDYDAYSSLTELSVLAMLDSEYGIEIEMEEFEEYTTVDDLLNLVKEKNNN